MKNFNSNFKFILGRPKLIFEGVTPSPLTNCTYADIYINSNILNKLWYLSFLGQTYYYIFIKCFIGI